MSAAAITGYDGRSLRFSATQRTRRYRRMVECALFDEELRAIRQLAVEMDSTSVAIFTLIVRNALSDHDYVRRVIMDAKKMVRAEKLEQKKYSPAEQKKYIAADGQVQVQKIAADGQQQKKYVPAEQKKYVRVRR